MKTNAKVFPALLLDVKHEGGFMKADFLYIATEGHQTFFHDKRNTDDIRTEKIGIIDRHRSQIRKTH